MITIKGGENNSTDRRRRSERLDRTSSGTGPEAVSFGTLWTFFESSSRKCRRRDAQTVGVFPEYVFRERSVRLRRVWSVTRGETVLVLGRVHEEKRVEGESRDELVDKKKRVRVHSERRNGEENDRNGNRRR